MAAMEMVGTEIISIFPKTCTGISSNGNHHLSLLSLAATYHSAQILSVVDTSSETVEHIGR